VASTAAVVDSTLDITAPTAARATGFSRFAWGTLGYTVLVVLFGAVVRITGSGAGCGQHWPTCHGEVTHLPRTLETAVELTHRATSGLSFFLVIGVFAWAQRSYATSQLVRRAAFASLVFMIFEVLIGAALVLGKLVGGDASSARALVMPVHLLVTSLLTGALTITAWTSARPASLSFALHGRTTLLIAIGLAGVVVVSTTGAVTALGDTLYPVAAGSDLAGRVTPGADAHFLERLRALHPVAAFLLAAYLLYLSSAVAARSTVPEAVRAAHWLAVLVVSQLALGVANIWLSAPGWLQVAHLALATLLWIVLVLLGAATLARPTEAGFRAARS
jgi:cytochrome c oxidase assembly protein subunit 15